MGLGTPIPILSIAEVMPMGPKCIHSNALDNVHVHLQYHVIFHLHAHAPAKYRCKGALLPPSKRDPKEGKAVIVMWEAIRRKHQDLGGKTRIRWGR